MTQGRSSSNRACEISDAVLWRDQRAVGPLRLPESRAEDFVSDFNRIYRGIGIVLLALERTPKEKVPGNSKIAGDFVLDD